MHIIIVAIMVAVVCVIGMMLQRIYQGPTVYDRMNGLGVTGADTILLIILFGYLDGRPVSNCGQQTASEIDEEVMKMLKDAYEEAKQLLRDHRQSLDRIAAFLIEKETITGKEFMEIFHQVIAKRNGNAEEAVENPENTETENTALPEADFTVNPEV